MKDLQYLEQSVLTKIPSIFNSSVWPNSMSPPSRCLIFGLNISFQDSPAFLPHLRALMPSHCQGEGT